MKQFFTLYPFIPLKILIQKLNDTKNRVIVGLWFSIAGYESSSPGSILSVGQTAGVDLSQLLGTTTAAYNCNRGKGFHKNYMIKEKKIIF